ncbi:MAG: diphosphate--fructose-6-phosphate 1-phosphotransferase [Bacteroidales bacterium]|nr:diphosphate--fructose-6-phosphate 1-phosphotransferase [Bacteroidales bacterium]
MKSRNIIIAQSGGPSPVINNTLRGIIDTCAQDNHTFGKIYGAWHGIEGILKEELLDISAQDKKEIDLLKTTPAAGSIGTCRYKLKEGHEKDLERIIKVFKAHNIGYFFYIGGNDSQHTVMRVSEKCKATGLDIISVGVPKTIDNDLGDNEFKLIDHTPGYGSVARYWSFNIQNLNEENRGSSPADPVMVVQVMGRKIGFIPAATRLADPERELPLQIYMAESNVSLPEMAENINKYLLEYGRCLAVVSEGFNAGDLGERKDAFGHPEFGASRTSVQQVIVNYLNNVKLKARGAARGQVPGTDQRHSMVYASDTDLDEAYMVGKKAVEIAASGENGWMATLIRTCTPEYNVIYDKVPLQEVALSERRFPEEWISENRYDVTDEFVRYAKPLTGNEWVKIPLVNGIQRFTRFKPIFAEKKLEKYIPEAY